MDRLVVLRLVASCNAVRRLKYSLILRCNFGLAGSSLHLDDQAQKWRYEPASPYKYSVPYKLLGREFECCGDRLVI